MRVKGILLVVLGMSLSFAVILGTLGVFSSSPKSRRAGHHPRIVTTPAQQGRQAVANGPGHRTRADAAAALAAIPKRLAAPQASDSAAPEPSTIGRIEALKKTLTSPSEHLSGVHADLEKQIASLIRNRDLMLDDLATELRRMTPEMAADEIRLLDTESVKLTLSRLTPVQRKAILRALDSTRAGVLDRNKRSLAAK